MKTNKSNAKRLKLTKNGKVVGRKAGQNHFNAKESRNSQLAKKRASSYEHYFTNKTKSRYLTK